MSAPETVPVKVEDLSVHALAKIIWETSRADEGAISAMGADIIAGAIAMADTSKTAEECLAEGPEVVCISGSTRFRGEMAEANRELTLAGYIVVAPGVFGHDGDQMTDEQKVALDALHFHKIEMADRVHVVNPGGYIGESTRREIAYAESLGKPITYSDTGIEKPHE